MEPAEPVQMNIYESNTYRKDLTWLHFDDESRVQVRQEVKDQQSCISVFVLLYVSKTRFKDDCKFDFKACFYFLLNSDDVIWGQCPPWYVPLSNFFKKPWFLPFWCALHFSKFCLSPFFNWSPLQNAKKFSPPFWNFQTFVVGMPIWPHNCKMQDV